MPRHLIFFQRLLLTVAAVLPLLTCVPSRAHAQSQAQAHVENAVPPSPAPSPHESPEEGPKIHVQALKPGANLAPFEKDSHYQTHPSNSAGTAGTASTAGTSPTGTPSTDLLPPRERDRLIAKAGLSDALSGWDAVDRDVLLLHAHSLSLDELKARYPKLPAESLKTFQQLVRPLHSEQ